MENLQLKSRYCWNILLHNKRNSQVLKKWLLFYNFPIIWNQSFSYYAFVMQLKLQDKRRFGVHPLDSGSRRSWRNGERLKNIFKSTATFSSKLQRLANDLFWKQLELYLNMVFNIIWYFVANIVFGAAQKLIRFMVSGRGTVGRAVTSNTEGLRFNTCHR